jgi:hypothetical protein
MAKDYNQPENNLGHPETSVLEWYSGDLRQRLMLSVRYLERIINPDYDNQPHFFFGRIADTGESVGMASKGTLMSHAVGRGMDLMLNTEKYTGIKTLPEVEAAYTRMFFDRLDSEFAMCDEFAGDDHTFMVELHNVRETVETIGLLITQRGDKRAYECIDKIFAGLDAMIDKSSGRYVPARLEERRLQNRVNGSIWAPQPQTAGRLTGPLMWLYRSSGDRRALEWAALFARGTLDCFTDDGEMLEAAGTHIHSLTSSLFGAADYAVTTRNFAMLDKLEKLYDNPKGMPLVVSSYGWVKEQIRVAGEVQGEVNQIGDMIQFQLHMGDFDFSVAAKWYSRAELFMRGGLLPAQVLETGFVNENAPNPEDGHKNGRLRMLGGYGFPMPASHLQHEDSPIDTLDITQGACQAICRLIDRITVRKNASTFINLYFDHENEVAMLRSELPKRGLVTVIPKIGGNIYFRIPDNIDRASMRFTVDGFDCPCIEINGYAKLVDRKRGDVIKFTFTPNITEYKEIRNEVEYTIKKFGEQVVSVTPIDGIYPMYYDFTR